MTSRRHARPRRHGAPARDGEHHPLSDAGITCMDSKYHYLLWRPVTAIRNADKDANTATDPSPTWSPLLTTPNHPEYPSAHGCVTAAVTDVLAPRSKRRTSTSTSPGNRWRNGAHHDTPLRHRSRTHRRRRQRPHLGRPALPLRHHRQRRNRPPSQQIRPEGQLPADEEVADRDQAAAIAAAALSNTSPPSQASTSAGTWVGA